MANGQSTTAGQAHLKRLTEEQRIDGVGQCTQGGVDDISGTVGQS